jgi:fumarate hydratase class I
MEFVRRGKAASTNTQRSLAFPLGSAPAPPHGSPQSLTEFAIEKIKTIGTSACPPYHLCFVVGGLSAEQCLKTVKLGSAKYLDGLPTSGCLGGRAFRDLEWEQKILKITQDMGIGAQFGGKYFCHDIRVIRLPRHGASCPVGLGVSGSADRQVWGKINKDGVFLEQLEEEPSKYLPEVTDKDESLSEEVVKVDLNKPMADIRKELSEYPIATRLSLTGTIIVARDIAHAKILERLEAGEEVRGI